MFGFSKGVTFDPQHDIPDLSGKAAVITGSNTGLGKETILQLAKHKPSRLYLAARACSKAEVAISDIQAVVPNANITFLQLDLASLETIEGASDTFLASSDRPDLLINNAGIMAQPPGLTQDGYKIQFGTNHIGHALLTKLLLPRLPKTAQLPGSNVRVVSLSSAGHDGAPPAGIIFPATTTSMRYYDTFERYGQSKAAKILFASELARSDAFRKSNGLKGRMSGAVLMLNGKSLTEGANNQLWCATGKSVVSGHYYHPVGAMHAGRGFPDDEALEEQLWDWTET